MLYLLFLQKGFLGLWGERVDSIEYYKQQLKEFDRRVSLVASLISLFVVLDQMNILVSILIIYIFFRS